MKKTCLVTLSIFLYVCSMAQNVFPASGNVGIGTTTPGAPLVVNGNARVLSTMTLGANEDGPAFFPLHIKTSNFATIGFTVSGQPVNQKVWAFIANGGGIRLITEADDYSAIREAMTFSRSGLDITAVAFPNGNVSIGTKDSKGYKLAVNGEAIFTRAKVKEFGNWPDYVFHKDYQLPALPALEQFIQQNKHLPGIPAAEEVQQKGLDLGENQAVLLKKIEELTLYIIEQNKQIRELQQQMEAIRKPNNESSILKTN